MDNKSNLVKIISASSAIAAALLFLVGILGCFFPMPDNWLIVIFKLLAGYDGVQNEFLYSLNFLDIFLLALFSLVMVGLYAALRNTSKIWSIVALVQPFLGIIIFVTTGSAGRSALMGAGLVISLVMLNSRVFSKWIAICGILTSLLLLAGDLSVSIAPSIFLAGLFGAAYLLLILWLYGIGRYLWQSRDNKTSEIRE
ncbi:MAG: hypothetical protein AB9891_22005 [Anaerolineaceae bacterium]